MEYKIKIFERLCKKGVTLWRENVNKYGLVSHFMDDYKIRSVYGLQLLYGVLVLLCMSRKTKRYFMKKVNSLAWA